MSSLDTLVDFLEAPEKAAAAVREDPPLGLGLGAYVLAGVSLYLAQALSGRVHLFGTSLVSLILACLWNVLMGLLFSSLVHLVAEASGGEGRALPLFVLLGLSELAWTLALPGVLILQAFGHVRRSFTALFFLVGLISLCLQARSVSLNYRITQARAWITLSVPYLAMFSLVFLVVSLAVWSLVAQIFKLAA